MGQTIAVILFENKAGLRHRLDYTVLQFRDVYDFQLPLRPVFVLNLINVNPVEASVTSIVCVAYVVKVLSGDVLEILDVCVSCRSKLIVRSLRFTFKYFLGITHSS